MAEVIDLTLPSSPIEILSEGEIPASLNDEASSSQKKTRKSRKRRKSTGLTDSVDISRNQSLERRSVGDSRIETVSRRRSASPNRRSPAPAVSDQELFYFDAAPASVVEPAEPTQSVNTQPEGSGTAEDRLLLPSHVSVLSTGEEGAVPVEIIPPPPIDSEGEDYIEYLDYEDRKVCKTPAAKWSLFVADVFHRHLGLSAISKWKQKKQPRQNRHALYARTAAQRAFTRHMSVRYKW
jgi:protein AIR1/2